MIKTIEFQNFKGFKNAAKIELKQLSLFSGLNCAGKSSIAQILQMVSESLMPFWMDSCPFLSLNGQSLQLGTVDDILNVQSKNLSIRFVYDDDFSILLEFGKDSSRQRKKESSLLLKKICIEDRNEQNESLKFECKETKGKWEVNSTRLLSMDVEYDKCLYSYVNEKIKKEKVHSDIVDEKGDLCRDWLYSPTVEFKNLSLSDIKFRSFIISDVTIDERCLGSVLQSECSVFFQEDEFANLVRAKELGPCTLFVYKAPHFFKKLMELADLLYLPPFRGMPQRAYFLEKNDNPLIKLNQLIQKKVAYDFNFEKKKVIYGSMSKALTYWMNDRLKIAEKVTVNELVSNYVTETVLTQNNVDLPISSVGFGVSQVLPLIVKVLSTNNSVIIVDEPECHLHPGLQSQIGYFLLVMAMIGKRIMVETHSEHIINVINYHSILKEFVRDSVVSYWVYQKDGSAQIEKIIYDDLGYTLNAPDGFYDEYEKTIEKFSVARTKKLLGE